MYRVGTPGNKASVSVASSPGPAQKLRKGPDHTCETFCMYCHQSSFGVEESIEGSRLVPRPFENGNEVRRLFVNLEI